MGFIDNKFGYVETTEYIFFSAELQNCNPITFEENLGNCTYMYTHVKEGFLLKLFTCAGGQYIGKMGIHCISHIWVLVEKDPGDYHASFK